MVLTDETLKWIEENFDEDISKLRLRYHKQMTDEIDFAIMQIECRHKAAKKLPETLSEHRFVFPTTLSAEQCTSDLLSRYHSAMVADKRSVIDLTSGLGIDVIHFARKSDAVTAIEREPAIAQALTQNASTLGLGNINVINADCVDFIKSCETCYDVAFIDPARRGTDGRRLFALSDCEPDVTSMLPELKKMCRCLIVKASPMLDVKQILRELPDTTQLYVLGTAQECKELVAVADFENGETESQVKIHAVTLWNDRENKFTFNYANETQSQSKYGLPEVGQYLYEPYPVVMKAAPVKLLSQKYDICKLHNNTHLYVSEQLLPDFPGDIFRIEEVIPFSSKNVKCFNSKYPKINVAARNFVMSADELRRKLKVRDGGDKRVVGCTLCDNNRSLIVLSKV